MEIHGIRIDTESVATKLWEFIQDGAASEDELVAMKYGMTPARIMMSVKDALERRFNEIAMKSINATREEMEQFNAECGVKLTIDSAKRDEFVRTSLSDIHCQLLRLAGCVA